ncbi:MAG: homocysteine biosynthesis protein [Bacillota bacterium]
MTGKSYEQINRRITRGEAVVLTAEEVTQMGRQMSAEEIAEKVDVVTTGTFSPMCSSGAFLNLGHSRPPIRMERISLNGVPACAGLAAVDAYLGATATASPGDTYGGAHVIEALIRGEDVRLVAEGKGTDCYPRRRLTRCVSRDTINEMVLYNPRNAYQNYAAAANSSGRTRYTYMGVLRPDLGNVNYCTAGELSPLLNCPDLQTVGLGTRVFLCGAQGYIVGRGTQFDTSVAMNGRGIPLAGAATLALSGDMRQMEGRWVRAAYYPGYGVSLFVGVGIPIPVLNAEVAAAVSVSNDDIYTRVLDFGREDHPVLGVLTYSQLQSGTVELSGRRIRTSPLSSLHRARLIALELRAWIERGEFLLTEPVQSLTQPEPIRCDVDGAGGERAPEPEGSLPGCIHCGACTSACDWGALCLLPDGTVRHDATRCRSCGRCADACPLQLLPPGGRG